MHGILNIGQGARHLQGGTEMIPGTTAGGPREGHTGRDLWAVVLAGGEGMRLRRFVRQVLGSERPKQFCRIVGRRSMLRHTWDRALGMVDPAQIVTVITAGQEPYLAEEEAGAGVPGTVLVQPGNKDTAPGLLLPLVWIAAHAPGATVVVFPADHFIWEEDRFTLHVRAATGAALDLPDRLVLLGVEADSPDVGYGWIAPGEPVGAGPAAEVYAVRRFWEKPDRATAAHLFARGYFWNTLVLAGRLEAYLGLAAVCVPQVLGPLRAMDLSSDTTPAAAALAAAYGCIPSTNLSHAMLARCPQGLMVLAARGVAWSDWGDPDRIVRTLRRFDRRPSWLLAYARARAAGAGASAVG